MAAKVLNNTASEGSNLGASATDKIGFWGVTPVVQPAASAFPAVATTAVISSSTSATCFGFTSAQATALLTLANGMRAMGVTAGIWST
jgi:hypothetical protein